MLDPIKRHQGVGARIYPTYRIELLQYFRVLVGKKMLTIFVICTAHLCDEILQAASIREEPGRNCCTSDAMVLGPSGQAGEARAD